MHSPQVDLLFHKHGVFFFNSFIFGCTGSSLPRGLFLVAVSRGCSLVEVLGLLIVVASLVAEHGL